MHTIPKLWQLHRPSPLWHTAITVVCFQSKIWSVQPSSNRLGRADQFQWLAVGVEVGAEGAEAVEQEEEVVLVLENAAQLKRRSISRN